MKNPIKYPIYKESDVVWLHEIPSHWKIVKAKRIFHETSIKNHPDEPLLAATQTKGVIPKALYENTTVTATKNFETLKFVKKGDFVISLRSFQGGIEYAHYQGIISPAYTILEPQEKVVHNYYRYLLKSKHYISGLTLLVTGIREGQNIDTGKFKDSFLPVPSKVEQTQIAAFLDYKLSKIDRFIRKKKQLIKLLNEQKAAIIKDAVTKGLNSNVKMKPSGIERLGDIPEHWKVIKLRHLAKIKTGRTPKIESSSINYFEYGTINWFTPGDFGKEGLLSYAKRKVCFEAIQNKQIELFPADTVYLIGIGGTIGKVGFCKNKASANQQINAIIFNSKIIPKFGYYSLKCSKHQIDLLADFTTLPILNQSKTKEILIPCPNHIIEQIDIVSFIEKETSKIDKIISTIENEIALTQEYKTALIAEAVTGKIDVRDFEIPTSLEVESYEELEEELGMVAEVEAEYELLDKN